jgi:hypothetical protein
MIRFFFSTFLITSPLVLPRRRPTSPPQSGLLAGPPLRQPDDEILVDPQSDDKILAFPTCRDPDLYRRPEGAPIYHGRTNPGELPVQTAAPRPANPVCQDPIGASFSSTGRAARRWPLTVLVARRGEAAPPLIGVAPEEEGGREASKKST